MPPIPETGFLRTWDLLQYLLPWSIRIKAYEPMYYELLKDYLITIRYKTGWPRLWLTFCFAFRTVTMFGNCLGLLVGLKMKKIVLNRLGGNVVKSILDRLFPRF